MATQNLSFEQSSTERDLALQVAALAAMKSYSSSQSVGVSLWGCRPGGGKTAAAIAAGYPQFDLVAKLADSWLLCERKAASPSRAKIPPQQNRSDVLRDNGEATVLAIVCRVAISLIEREQINLARKILDALSVGRLENPMIVQLRKTLAVPTTRTSQKQDVDRQRDFGWIRDHAQEYRGQWVALDNGQLLATAASLRELLDQVKKLQLPRSPLLHQLT